MRPVAKWYECPTRLNMMVCLSDSPKSGSEICEHVGMTVGNFYTHSIKLQDDGLIAGSQETPVRFDVTPRGWQEMASFHEFAEETAAAFRIALTYSNRIDGL